jgi:hypothetical protein
MEVITVGGDIVRKEEFLEIINSELLSIRKTLLPKPVDKEEVSLQHLKRCFYKAKEGETEKYKAFAPTLAHREDICGRVTFRKEGAGGAIHGFDLLMGTKLYIPQAKTLAYFEHHQNGTVTLWHIRALR